tara:strand:- start:50 stop:541 length:492 start_codon:yes stop_codon:yes gene_type:complete
MTFRDGGARALDAEARTQAQDAANAVLNDPAVEVSYEVTKKPNVKAYFEYILYLQGKKWSPNSDGAKAGGPVSLAGGGYLGGSTDGMADQINTSIDGQQPAALSDGEFVLPADVVSHLGNGNSDAGADILYSMMSDVRKARTGTTKQGTQIDPSGYLPSRGIA